MNIIINSVYSINSINGINSTNSINNNNDINRIRSYYILYATVFKVQMV